MVTRSIIFLVINFAALGIGGWLMARGPVSEWYLALDKAPWTPPGWMFGTAWTLIMITFSLFMAYAWGAVSDRNVLLAAFIIQLALNIGWNPVFFRYHHTAWGLLIILALTLLVAYFFFNYLHLLKWKSLLVLPYLLWLLVASSLNAFIVIKN